MPSFRRKPKQKPHKQQTSSSKQTLNLLKPLVNKLKTRPIQYNLPQKHAQHHHLHSDENDICIWFNSSPASITAPQKMQSPMQLRTDVKSISFSSSDHDFFPLANEYNHHHQVKPHTSTKSKYHKFAQKLSKPSNLVTFNK